METFRYKSKGNDAFQSFSNFRKRIAQSHQSLKQNRQYYPHTSRRTSFAARKNQSQTELVRSATGGTKQSESSSRHKNSRQRLGIIVNLMKRNLRDKTVCTYGQQNDSRPMGLKARKIDLAMIQKKNQYNLTLRNNYQKLNHSFKNTFQNALRYNFAEKNKFKLSQTQSIDIKVQTKSRKKIVFKGESKQKQNGKQGSNDQTFLKENNLFNVEIQSTKCFNGIFPMFRNGSTLVALGTDVYLFGGVNSKIADSFHFHRYLPSQKVWTSIQNKLDTPNVIPSFHSVQIFKNSLLFLGGTTVTQPNSNKAFNSDILIFDTERQQWQKIRWKVRIRCHASTIYGNMLVIYGGICQKGQFSNKLYFLPLNSNCISQTRPTPYNLGSHGQGIAHHKLVNTFQIDSSLKKQIQIDGIICYGGKFSDGNLNQDLTLFRFCKNKEGTETQSHVKGWQVIEAKGVKPQPRYNHSMNILSKKCICFVIGGLDKQEIPLSDAWILDLTTSTWIQALFDSTYQVIQRGIFSHTTTVVNSQIFVFGGSNGQNKLNNYFWSIDFNFSRAAKRQVTMRISKLTVLSINKQAKQFSHFKESQTQII